MLKMILINSEEKAEHPIADRGFQYGDGCFTTMMVKFGQIQHWHAHLARLQRDTNALAINCIDWQQLKADLARVTATLQTEAYSVVKILISRGIGGQGYSPINCQKPTVVISSHNYPKHYLTWQKQGIRLALLKQPIGLSPLAGIKHLNRLEQILLKQELARLDVEDGVVCCINGNVIETTASNIFWRKGKQIYTPSLTFAGVLGTQRAVIIKTLQQMNVDVQQVQVKPEILLAADEIFICNALMELIPVKQIEMIQLKDYAFYKELMLRLK